jgi:hypothetical protein
MPDASFLWAGDYVQNVEEATLYATEVIRAIRREGVHPSSVAAQCQQRFRSGQIQRLRFGHSGVWR